MGNEKEDKSPILFSHPGRETDEAARCWLQEHSLPEWHTVEAELPEGDVELEVALGHSLDLVAEALRERKRDG